MNTHPQDNLRRMSVAALFMLLSLFSCSVPSDSAPPRTVACQAPLSMGFPRQEYWSGLPFLSPGDLPDPEIGPMSPALQVDSLSLSHQGFPHSSIGKESACIAGDLGLIPGLGRSPGERNGNPLQYSCLENPMDRGAWQAPWGCNSQTQLSN